MKEQSKVKAYSIKINANDQIEVSTMKNGKKVSIADGRRVVGMRLETRSQVVKRLCSQLGVKF